MASTVDIDWEARIHDPEKEFRDELVSLVRVSSTNGMPSKDIQQFMARSDEFPRFVWEYFLLSFCQYCTMETVGPYALDRLSQFIEFYPDIFQRELLRDSFELAYRPLDRPRERYGALHAAVLCGRTDLVYLLRGPGKYREKIFKVLVPAGADDVSNSLLAEDDDDSFYLLRRALLWRHMQKMGTPYTRVAALMRRIEKVRNPQDREALEELIDLIAQQIYLTRNPYDAFDPRIVILAWSSVSKRHRHIIEEFQERQPEIFQQIAKSLLKHRSVFYFLLIHKPKDAGSVKINLYDNRQVEVGRTVQDILKILVLGQGNVGIDVSRRSHKPSMEIGHMQKFFLDRFCERTPDSRWTPLHFAAVRGDQNMVSVLIASWELLCEKLRENEKEHYTRKLEETFYDAKYMTPLHYAVLGNHKEVVKSLVEWKKFAPHVNECDIFMRTAFQIACSKQERADIAELLVQNPIVEAGIDSKDCCGFNVTHWAVSSGSKAIAKVLIERKDAVSSGRLVSFITKYGARNIQQELLNFPPVKNEVDRFYRDRQVYVDASNAILVGAALIASVTFGGWLQPPLGNNQESTQADVRIFWGFNSLSFFFSIATVMAGAVAMLPVGEDNDLEYAVMSIRKWLVVSSILLIFSVASVLGAFTGAGFGALSVVPNLTGIMIITTIIGTAMCTTIGVFFIARLWRVRPFRLGGGFREKADSLIKLEPVNVSHRTREDFSFPIRKLVKDFCFRIRERRSDIFDPSQPPFLTLGKRITTSMKDEVLLRVSPDSLSIGVDRERIRDLLCEKIHQRGNINGSCPIRSSYLDLENFCLTDILNLNDCSRDSLKEYIAMWTDLSEYPLDSNLRDLRTDEFDLDLRTDEFLPNIVFGRSIRASNS